MPASKRVKKSVLFIIPRYLRSGGRQREPWSGSYLLAGWKRRRSPACRADGDLAAQLQAARTKDQRPLGLLNPRTREGAGKPSRARRHNLLSSVLHRCFLHASSHKPSTARKDARSGRNAGVPAVRKDHAAAENGDGDAVALAQLLQVHLAGPLAAAVPACATPRLVSMPAPQGPRCHASLVRMCLSHIRASPTFPGWERVGQR